MAIARKNAACVTCTPVSSNSAELEQSFSSSRFAIMKRTFADIAMTIAHQSGRKITFVGAVVIIAACGGTGPVFHFSDTWQLIINTGTTIITFLMVFVIQNT